jgi:hypothetical protein
MPAIAVQPMEADVRREGRVRSLLLALCSFFVCSPCSALSLHAGKIEAGQLQLHYAAANIGDVVDTSLMLCYELAVTKGISLTWHLDPSLPREILIDPTRLQQILLNLLSNVRFACVRVLWTAQ